MRSAPSTCSYEHRVCAEDKSGRRAADVGRRAARGRAGAAAAAGDALLAPNLTKRLIVEFSRLETGVVRPSGGLSRP
jgi:hypothetical protein